MCYYLHIYCIRLWRIRQNPNNSVGYLRSAWVIELHACVRFNIYALRFGSSNLAPACSLEKRIGGDSLQAGVREADNSMKPSSLEQNTIRRLSNDEQRSA